MKTVRQRFEVDHYVAGVLRADRVVLAQAISLVESTLESDQPLGEALLQKIVAHTGRSLRIGITGVPGVGKSTFIEAFGMYVVGLGKKIAVLTVDPTSQLSKGSILGDKTRMETLSKNPSAFIRPTASGTVLGGVAANTREVMLLCEAAGYDVIVIETVGVGQSEVGVRNMVDFFLLLMLAGAGDELQGIKKGIMEMADGLVITKADGDNEVAAREAQATYRQALHLLASASHWQPRVLTASAVTGVGIADVWQMMEEYHRHTTASGSFAGQRQQQDRTWLHHAFQQLLQQHLTHNRDFQETLAELENDVAQRHLSGRAAASRLLQTFLAGLRHP